MNRLLTPALALAVLAVTAAGCMSPPKNLDLALTRSTVDKKYVVTLQPPPEAAAINQLHAWQVKLTSTAGVPVANARIKVDGGMPQHGHDLPTRPEVTTDLGEGSHLIEGMKFNMPGWWILTVSIDGPNGADKATFNLVL